METTICFDFGNTRLKAAVFGNGELLESFTLPGDGFSFISSLLDKYSPKKTILSSVVDHNPQIENLLSSVSSFHKLSHLTKANFTTPVGKPQSIGADRLALAAAAVHYFPGKNNLVIGLGSCITYNFINQYHQFIGGSISPGMEMRFKALHQYTDKLPLVEPEWSFPLLGYDTKTNMLGGVIGGMAFEMEGFINAYIDKYDNFNVVLTGGDSSYFARRLKYKIFADSNFLFKGLYALSETNNG